MKAYYGSRISPNQTETNEGYLIAHNVPIARTGSYEYMGSEIGADNNEIIKVIRDPEEVFSPTAISSFEGKPVVNEHPPSGLTAVNATDFSKGTVTNVRRGKGSDADLLLADLIIYDQSLIDAIRNGKREVSAGYECEYMPNDDGTYSQVGIIGNHVAVVDQGRAGHRVRINDKRTFDDSQTDEEDEKAAKKYGISVKRGAPRTPPKGYPEDRSEYGDPVNYKYPIDKSHIEHDPDYFNRSGEREKGDYTKEEWAKIGKRIADAANRLLHKGYEYKDGKVVDTKTTHDSKGGKSMKLKIPSRMPTSVTRAFAAMGFKQYAMDAEPDEIMDAWDAMSEEEQEEKDRARDADPNTSKETDDDEADRKDIDELKKQVAELKELLEKATQAKDEKTAEETLDEELEKIDSDDDDGDDGDETGTVETDDDPGPVAPDDERTRNGFTGDSAAKRAVLQSIKPILATIPDEKTRRQVVDAAIASFKGRSGKNTYGRMARDTKTRTQKKQQQQQDNVIDYSELGNQIRDKYNPHYMKRNNQA